MTARVPIGIVLNGVTGRMGYRQHLVRSILPIRDQGGVLLEDGSRVQVEPILLGRNASRVRELAELHGVESWSTDQDDLIADDFLSEADAQTAAGLILAGNARQLYRLGGADGR